MTEDSKLPCDVMLPPNTIIRKGCALSVLMTALKVREADPLFCPHFPPDSSGIRERK